MNKLNNSGHEAADAISRMQRGILRLALAYHGQDSQLDRKLKEFGTLIRGDTPQASRNKLIDEIVEAVLGLQAAKPASSSDEVDPAPYVNLLEQIDSPKELAAEIDSVRQQLSAARDRDALLEAVRNTAATVSDLIARSPTDTPNSDDCQKILLDLLERLPVSKKLVQQLGPVRHRIETAKDGAGYRVCVDLIIKLIEALRTELKTDVDNLENFIKKIAQRLVDFDQFVNQASELQTAGTNDALQLSDTLAGEMQCLREEAAACNDIDDVRGLIDTRLDNIGEGLNHFAALQEEREAESKQALETMSSKLHDLETQTETLRLDLEEQHARVLLDPLTGVLNRTGYSETASKLFARWMRYGGHLSLAVIDLDLFKKINDDYGHSAGDKVLATVAARIKEQIRSADVLCRYGGEEFVLLLPETNARDGRDIIEKLRLSIAECPFRYKDTPVRITLSCGVAQFNRGDMLEDVFERADRAMYEAKSNGRNQVCAVDAAGTRLEAA